MITRTRDARSTRPPQYDEIMNESDFVIAVLASRDLVDENTIRTIRSSFAKLVQHDRKAAERR